MKRALGAVLVALLATAGILVAVAGASSAAQTDPVALAPEATPVIMVHGYSGASCPGGNVLHDIWGGLYVTLANAGWTGALLPVSFYQCDTNGVDITGYGPTPPEGATTAITSGYPRAGYTDSTGLPQIAHDLAWFVYDTYSSAGSPVDLVGGSMGGLIVRYALYRVAQHDPDFPPYLYAYHVVTVSTPHEGYGTLASNTSFCGGTVQCEQMATDSAFIADLKANALDPQGWGGSAWSVLGSDAGCDYVPASSSLAMPDAEQIDYTSPCYSHTGYVTDYATTLDATTVVSTPGTAAQTSTTAPHGLQLLRQVLSRAEVLVPPSPTPTPPSTPPSTPTSGTPTPTPTSATPTSSTPTPDTTAPTLAVRAPGAPFQASTALRFAYQAADPGSGVLGYEARYRVAAWNSGFGPYTYPAAWQRTTATSLTLSGSTGRQYCFSVRATDRVGNVSAWTPDRCTSVALDDRSLSAVTRGWSRQTSSGYYFHTKTRTSLRGAELRVRSAHLDRLALVVAECRTCGKLAIYLGNTLWRTVNTYASSTHYRVIVVEARFSLRIATVTLKNADGKVTVIDGLAISRT